MYRRVARCRLDHVLALAGRLRALLLLVLLGAPVASHAATTYTTHTQAMAACQAWAANEETNVAKDAECREGTYTDGRPEVQGWEIIYYISGGVRTSQVYSPWAKRQDYIYTTPINPCDSAPTVSGSLAGKVLQGYSFCTPVTSGGATVMCRMNVSVSGPPTMNQWGSWHTPGSSTSSGSTCDGSPGNGGWKAPNGSTPVPTPPDPTTTPPTNPPPKACGGGSCYDPNNDNFCAVSDGVQICIPGNTARQPGGGCASSGDSTICAGSPSAPTPPAAQVPDPPTAVTNNDSYTQADPSTGTNQNVTVISYTNQGGTQSTSGQSAGDSGPPATGGDPAPGSSTASPPGSYSGGGDCGSPPVCAGDAVMCGVARQEWTAMCQAKKDSAQLHKDLTGDGPPSDFDSLKTKYAQSDVWSDTPPTGDGGAGDAANAGNYDMSGFGYGTTCPLVDLTVDAGKLGQFVVPFSNACVVGDWVRGLILAMALYAAWQITKGAGMKGIG
ncbi:hypothetical protein LQ772_08090 [Frateuria edaphi]|uniref:hypothetical protein n=1 Tax=Frateuria edaphi TaxID=2898793 RepID=UPI001E2AA5D3|nr:hypothetical protein [Frateuria edaphi]UGB47229.1 hypothetical protein LQ772_08090 [Frateuria edaphi]